MDDQIDPMADFLAREQAILGADAALFDNPVMDVIETPVFGTTSNEIQFDEFPATEIETPKPLFEDFQNGDIEQFENQPKQQFSPVFTAQPQEPAKLEPSPQLIEWQQRFDSLVQERDQKEQDKHDRVLKEAKQVLDKFYAEYNEKKEKAIQKNKELEKSLISQRNQKLQGNVWVSILIGTRKCHD